MESTRAARGRRLPPAERRASIIKAAREIALAEGLSALTLRAIASHADITHALVAHYVPSMEQLVADIFSSIARDEMEDVMGLVPSGQAVVQLSCFLQALVADERADGNAVWSEAVSLGQQSEVLVDAVHEESSRWRAALEPIISNGVQEGVFDVESAADAAWQLMGMIEGVNLYARVRWGEASDRLLLLERAVDGMLGAKRGTLENARLQASASESSGDLQPPKS